MTLLSVFDPRHNSLNAVRLLMALLVALSHGVVLGGYGPEPTIGGVSLGRWAVFGFFAISGFLITRSRLSPKPTRDFYKARFLRIFPAFAVSLMVVAFIIAPISRLYSSTGEYTASSALTFVLRNLALYPPVVQQQSISDTLSGNIPFPNMWNGSLWTLWYEALCYLAIGVLVSVVSRKLLGPMLAVVFVGLSLIRLLSQWKIWEIGALLDLIIPLALAFLAGSLLHLYAGRIKIGLVSTTIITAVAIVIVSLRLAEPLIHLPFGLLLILVAQVLPLQKVGSKYDISYGVYIYAWPVQQCVALAFPLQILPFWAILLITFPPVLALSGLSCKFIEQPASRIGRTAQPAASTTKMVYTK